MYKLLTDMTGSSYSLHAETHFNFMFNAKFTDRFHPKLRTVRVAMCVCKLSIEIVWLV